MQYHGKLYGKIGRKLIPLKLTSDDVDELERDKARLDWLADPGNEIGAVQLPRKCVEENLDSLRSAIDAAMEMKGRIDE